MKSRPEILVTQAMIDAACDAIEDDGGFGDGYGNSIPRFSSAEAALVAGLRAGGFSVKMSEAPRLGCGSRFRTDARERG
jgi:hypothetical protein